ncbi:unnamed protein product [Closterium sp. NIES-65]|nr:unnamed protein product [Closterium sp. NIES-65]
MAVYRGQYWALLEELRAKYRRFCMRTGESGWKEPAHPSATGGTGGAGEGSDFPFPPASRPHAPLPPPPPPLAPPFSRDTSLRAAAGGNGLESGGAGGDRGAEGEGGAAGGNGAAGAGGAARPEPHAPDKPANATLHCAAPGPCLAKPLALSVFWAPIAGRTCPADAPPFPPSPPSSAPTTATSFRQLSSPSRHVTGDPTEDVRGRGGRGERGGEERGEGGEWRGAERWKRGGGERRRGVK